MVCKKIAEMFPTYLARANSLSYTSNLVEMVHTVERLYMRGVDVG